MAVEDNSNDKNEATVTQVEAYTLQIELAIIRGQKFTGFFKTEQTKQKTFVDLKQERKINVRSIIHFLN